MILNQMCPNCSYLIHALLSRNQLCRDDALFGGALLAKIWWEGAQKHFKGPGPPESSLALHFWPQANSPPPGPQFLLDVSPLSLLSYLSSFELLKLFDPHLIVLSQPFLPPPTSS